MTSYQKYSWDSVIGTASFNFILISVVEKEKEEVHPRSNNRSENRGGGRGGYNRNSHNNNRGQPSAIGTAPSGATAIHKKPRECKCRDTVFSGL